ncbi:helix-turn-helix transcriptional regulator [Lysobacter sp. D1-1-M9]|uniref:helix-turn-helix transcriptional regulator n=1 Tax=Novilysobacter longmucuonensis TaxID=3098603 RepID=UPI003983246B
MARAACASPYHFARRFRQRTGKSPMEYVMGKRIESAKNALAGDSSRICALAQDLGFSDQSHFCRTFSRYVGVTPRAFRLQMHGHPLKE